jgi:hypothetical protein
MEKGHLWFGLRAIFQQTMDFGPKLLGSSGEPSLQSILEI